MKHTILSGHGRAITKVKYTLGGDIIITSGKNISAFCWKSSTGESVRSFDGHNGTIWCIDMDWKGEKLLSGGGDMNLCLWDIETGKVISKVEKSSPIRSCAFSFTGNTIIYSTDAAMSKPCELIFTDIRDPSSLTSDISTMTVVDESKITCILPDRFGNTVISGHEFGELRKWDWRARKVLASSEGHSYSRVNDIQSNKTGSMFVTASNDYTAKLWDTTTLQCLKTYKTERPVNSAAVSPIFEHILLGGGENAMNAASIKRQGNFEARFFNQGTQHELARAKGPFGPINSLAFHPAGIQFVSGSEDGLVRVYDFDSEYLEHQSFGQDSI